MSADYQLAPSLLQPPFEEPPEIEHARVIAVAVFVILNELPVCDFDVIV